ncbi:hypothetical protein [Oceanithermus desulfurans]|uniref:Uncharacterized protein n=2 Tax=Oceanithermus desulfurans TaxID=227924 RepID=A0A511RM30_9DEIN|nr:hypothetical protein [Oceanithermus desulfurans]MBB6029904.1 hypothetical protein [Oceanithermus desulfurans]GEM89866.1 hypothetical protein ODE01S_13000 [Oceanithermus desulfurans NBRC 100063]
MPKVWVILLVCLLGSAVLADGKVPLGGVPGIERFIAQVLALEERIPGYSGTYYDKERGEIVVRIVPRLNPKLARMLGDRADALPLDRELRLPRMLAREYEQIVRELRLGPSRKNTPIRFAVGKYTWPQHFKWQAMIYKFWSDPHSMAAYGYPEWPRRCVQSTFVRDVKEDKSYVFVLKSNCDEKFFQSFLRAIHEQLGIPTDAIGFHFLTSPLRLL